MLIEKPGTDMPNSAQKLRPDNWQSDIFLASKSGPLHIVGGFGTFAGVPNFDDVQVHRVGEVSLALGRVGLVWWIGRHSNTRPRTA